MTDAGSEIISYFFWFFTLPFIPEILVVMCCIGILLGFTFLLSHSRVYYHLIMDKVYFVFHFLTQFWGQMFQFLRFLYQAVRYAGYNTAGIWIMGIAVVLVTMFIIFVMTL